MLSKTKARELAKAECEKRQLPFREPVLVTRGPFRTTIFTNSGVRGGNVCVRLGTRTGAVISVWVNPHR